MNPSCGPEPTPAVLASGMANRNGACLHRPTRRQHGQVGVLLLLFGLAAGYFSIQVPAFETPDEFQHYAVVQHIVTWYDLPKSEPNTPGLWRQQGVQVLVGPVELALSPKTLSFALKGHQDIGLNAVAKWST